MTQRQQPGTEDMSNIYADGRTLYQKPCTEILFRNRQKYTKYISMNNNDRIILQNKPYKINIRCSANLLIRDHQCDETHLPIRTSYDRIEGDCFIDVSYTFIGFVGFFQWRSIWEEWVMFSIDEFIFMDDGVDMFPET
ncbi:hypothetical protein LXL04_020385 [Taraxacum kok-saghyz]